MLKLYNDLKSVYTELVVCYFDFILLQKLPEIEARVFKIIDKCITWLLLDKCTINFHIKNALNNIILVSLLRTKENGVILCIVFLLIWFIIISIILTSFHMLIFYLMCF